MLRARQTTSLSSRFELRWMLRKSTARIVWDVSLSNATHRVHDRQLVILLEHPGGKNGTRPSNAREAVNQHSPTWANLGFNELENAGKIGRWPEIGSFNEQIPKAELFGIRFKGTIVESDDAGDSLFAQERSQCW